jgi:hypothetical protein
MNVSRRTEKEPSSGFRGRFDATFKLDSVVTFRWSFAPKPAIPGSDASLALMRLGGSFRSRLSGRIFGCRLPSPHVPPNRASQSLTRMPGKAAIDATVNDAAKNYWRPHGSVVNAAREAPAGAVDTIRHKGANVWEGDFADRIDAGKPMREYASHWAS